MSPSDDAVKVRVSTEESSLDLDTPGLNEALVEPEGEEMVEVDLRDILDDIDTLGALEDSVHDLEHAAEHLRGLVNVRAVLLDAVERLDEMVEAEARNYVECKAKMLKTREAFYGSTDLE